LIGPSIELAGDDELQKPAKVLAMREDPAGQDSVELSLDRYA
jgi:hypothetical protein